MEGLDVLVMIWTNLFLLAYRSLECYPPEVKDTSSARLP